MSMNMSLSYRRGSPVVQENPPLLTIMNKLPDREFDPTQGNQSSEGSDIFYIYISISYAMDILIKKINMM